MRSVFSHEKKLYIAAWLHLRVGQERPVRQETSAICASFCRCVRCGCGGDAVDRVRCRGRMVARCQWTSEGCGRAGGSGASDDKGRFLFGAVYVFRDKRADRVKLIFG